MIWNRNKVVFWMTSFHGRYFKILTLRWKAVCFRFVTNVKDFTVLHCIKEVVSFAMAYWDFVWLLFLFFSFFLNQDDFSQGYEKMPVTDHVCVFHLKMTTRLQCLFQVNILQKDLQLLFGLMKENLNEGSPAPSPGKSVCHSLSAVSCLKNRSSLWLCSPQCICSCLWSEEQITVCDCVLHNASVVVCGLKNR